MTQDPIHIFKITVFLNERIVHCIICKHLSHLIMMITIKMPLNKETIKPHVLPQLFIPLYEIKCVFEIPENHYIVYT